MDKPQFCTNKNCICHKKKLNRLRWCVRYGTYTSLVKGNIQRYICKYCGTTFSTQTFSLNYYVKRIISYRKILSFLSKAMSLSSISRVLKASVESISNRIERLARQVIVNHEYLKSYISLKEDLTADGFESFTKSQYFPDNIHLLGGKDSQYLYFLNYVMLKRKGRMTEYQKKRKNELYKNVDFPKGALSNSFRQVVDEVFSLAGTTDNHVSLYTDMKPEYRTVFMKHPLKNTKKVSHIVQHSKKHRTVCDDGFTNEYLDREIRKDLANHRRETKCFSRNTCNSINRLALYSFSHNYLKDYRVKRVEYKGITHAEVAGVPKARIREVLKTIFTKRVFFSLENVKMFYKDLWCKDIITPLKNRKDYIPKYALM